MFPRCPWPTWCLHRLVPKHKPGFPQGKTPLYMFSILLTRSDLNHQGCRPVKPFHGHTACQFISLVTFSGLQLRTDTLSAYSNWDRFRHWQGISCPTQATLCTHLILFALSKGYHSAIPHSHGICRRVHALLSTLLIEFNVLLVHRPTVLAFT